MNEIPERGFGRANYSDADRTGQIWKEPICPVRICLVRISRMQFGMANLTWVNSTAAKLIEAELIGATLERVILSESDLRRVKFSEANLENAILDKADLRNADLRNAILHTANPTKANLKDANLTNAEMRGPSRTLIGSHGIRLLHLKFLQELWKTVKYGSHFKSKIWPEAVYQERILNWEWDFKICLTQDSIYAIAKRL